MTCSPGDRQGTSIIRCGCRTTRTRPPARRRRLMQCETPSASGAHSSSLVTVAVTVPLGIAPLRRRACNTCPGGDGAGSRRLDTSTVRVSAGGSLRWPPEGAVSPAVPAGTTALDEAPPPPPEPPNAIPITARANPAKPRIARATFESFPFVLGMPNRLPASARPVVEVDK